MVVIIKIVLTNLNDKMMDIRLSVAITWLRFPLIFLITILHCYSVVRLEGCHETYFKVLCVRHHLNSIEPRILSSIEPILSISQEHFIR